MSLKVGGELRMLGIERQRTEDPAGTSRYWRAAVHAEAMTAFYREHFNPYLNFHRPCGVPGTTTALPSVKILGYPKGRET